MTDDKKKIAIVGVLALVVVAVGAFQFTGGGAAPLPDTTKKTAKKPTEAEAPKGPMNPAVANELPSRDPFEVPGEITAATAVTPPVPTPTPTPAAYPRPRPMTGDLPSLPVAGRVSYEPVHVEAPSFEYQLVGVLDGDHPIAVMQDGTGNQRLVPVGSAIDGDTKVTSIGKGSATLQFRGRTLRLTVGGNPSAK